MVNITNMQKSDYTKKCSTFKFFLIFFIFYGVLVISGVIITTTVASRAERATTSATTSNTTTVATLKNSAIEFQKHLFGNFSLLFSEAAEIVLYGFQ